MTSRYQYKGTGDVAMSEEHLHGDARPRWTRSRRKRYNHELADETGLNAYCCSRRFKRKLTVRSEDDVGDVTLNNGATALYNILGLGSLEPGDIH